MDRTKQRKGINNAVVAVGALVILLAIVLGLRMIKSGSSEQGAINKNGYQAVFLTNGQVYFGKVKRLDSSHVDLQDIYYLQTDTAKDSKETAADSLKDASNDIKLIKLGNELHGPTDRMLISKDQVIFWENLKDDGKVTAAIKEFSKPTE